MLDLPFKNPTFVPICGCSFFHPCSTQLANSSTSLRFGFVPVFYRPWFWGALCFAGGEWASSPRFLWVSTEHQNSPPRMKYIEMWKSGTAK